MKIRFCPPKSNEPKTNRQRAARIRRDVENWGPHHKRSLDFVVCSELWQAEHRGYNRACAEIVAELRREARLCFGAHGPQVSCLFCQTLDRMIAKFNREGDE